MPSTECKRVAGPHSMPKLPPEILELIVEAVLPPNRRALIPASHSATKTLVALTRVAKSTYGIASKLLHQQCLYLDTSKRLDDVLLCLQRCVPTMLQASSLRNITSLYLAPFGTSLDDEPIAQSVRELFYEVSPSLRRLVVEMPFSSLDPLEDHLNVRRTLREGFEQLTRLTEFVCLGDYPALSVVDAYTDVWRLWPDLRRLVLFNVPADSHWLWWDIATLSRLEHVVLARVSRLESTNIKDEYFHKLPPDDERLDRPINVVLVDGAYEMQEVRTERWKQIDPEGRMTVFKYETPMAFYADETVDEAVTAWTRRAALNGTIWDWEGELVATKS